MKKIFIHELAQIILDIKNINASIRFAQDVCHPINELKIQLAAASETRRSIIRIIKKIFTAVEAEEMIKKAKGIANQAYLYDFSELDFD